jgi:hypothetical protein
MRETSADLSCALTFVRLHDEGETPPGTGEAPTVKYMLLIYGDPEKFAALPADVRDNWHGEYMEFTQSIAATGELVAGDALQGVDTATTVTVENGASLTTDGPFAETKETLGGFYIVDVPDLDRALALAAQIPDARSGKVEVRAVLDVGAM